MQPVPDGLFARSRRVVLTAAFVLSVLLHLGVGWALVARPHGESAPIRLASLDTPDTRQADPDRVRFGLTESSQVTVNWLGFDVPSEPQTAPDPADVEQAAMTTDAAGAPTAGADPTPPTPQAQPPQEAGPTPAESAPQSQPQPQSEAEPADPQPDPGTADEPTSLGPTLTPADEPGTADVRLPEVDDPADLVQLARPSTPEPSDTPPEETPEEPTPQQPEPKPAEPTRPQQPSPQPAPPKSEAADGKTEGKGRSDLPGEQAEREAVATALKEAIDVNLSNRVSAGKGVEITTVHPRWGMAVGYTAWPSNRAPVVLIRFGPDGRVSSAKFLEERRDGQRLIYGSGDPAIDQPLLDAIYRWTAKGERIDKLDAEDPDNDELEVSVRIRLR